MAFNSEYFLHPDDSAALQALKAIPGFSHLMKGFMKEFSERQIRLRCLSSYIRLGENQLPKYKEMLKPICEKLGIDVPELYLMMDVRPNAFTAGENEPYIVLTSGLLEIIPEELIPTVLAHECGHIACHHVLYRTMGTILFGTLSGSLNVVPFGGLITLPLQMAFYHWMRCSEFSADRAAVLVDGSADKTAELCMRLAGFDQKIHGQMNLEAFLDQAREYRAQVKDDAGNKSMESLMLLNATHPFAALRALEALEWAETDQYKDILNGTYVPPVKEETPQKSIIDFDEIFKIFEPEDKNKKKAEDKLICPSCGTENKKGAKFCMHCGTSLEPVKLKCPSCGEELDGSETFCPKCGKRIKD